MPERHDQNKNNSEAAYERIGDRVSIFQRGKRWYANYQCDGEQIRQSLKTTSKKQARQNALVLEGKLIEGRYERPCKAPSIEGVFSEYVSSLKAQGRAKKTLSAVELVQRRVLALARQRQIRTVDRIDLSFVDAYRNMRTAGDKKPADKTMATELVIIRQMVNFALSRGKIQQDPLKGLKLKKAKPRPQPCWTRSEVARILAASSGPHRPSLVLLAESGMRVGELRWLTWDDVDLAAGVIQVRPKDDWKPKTGDQRAIPISAAARAELEALPRRHRWVVTAAPSRRYPKGDRQISERRLLQYLKRVLKRLALPGHLHTFRHSFISDALAHGTPEAIVRQWVGHVDQEILRHYTHIHDAASQTAMQRLDRARNQSLQ